MCERSKGLFTKYVTLKNGILSNHPPPRKATNVIFLNFFGKKRLMDFTLNILRLIIVILLSASFDGKLFLAWVSNMIFEWKFHVPPAFLPEPTDIIMYNIHSRVHRLIRNRLVIGFKLNYLL